MYIQETFVNKTEDYIIGKGEVCETFTDNVGRLFHSLAKDYGRCVSKVYIDEAGVSKPIGWVFQKQVYYTDCREKYMQEVWVTLHEDEPTRTIEYHYKYL